MPTESEEGLEDILELLADLELEERRLAATGAGDPLTAAGAPAAAAEPEAEPGSSSSAAPSAPPPPPPPPPAVHVHVNVSQTQSVGGAGGQPSDIGAAPPAEEARTCSRTQPSSWELPSRPRNASAAARGAAASTARGAEPPLLEARFTPGGAASAPVPQARLERAATAGKFAAQKASGLLRFVPRTPPLDEEGLKNVFVIIRAKPPLDVAGIVFGGFDDIRGYVCSGRGLHPDVVFHGFTSRDEGVAYWVAATRGGTPLPVLPPRRD